MKEEPIPKNYSKFLLHHQKANAINPIVKIRSFGHISVASFNPIGLNPIGLQIKKLEYDYMVIRKKNKERIYDSFY